MNDKLKPCPFCGSPAELIYNLDGEDIATCSNKGGDCHNVSAYGVYLNEWQRRPLEDALNARIAELEASRRWIPVGERLPEEKQNVLALDRTGTAYHWEYSRSLSNIFVSDYTHWMPLPEVPNV